MVSDQGGSLTAISLLPCTNSISCINLTAKKNPAVFLPGFYVTFELLQN
jgi:hypothetical protein